jgi:anoctamin-7
MTGVNKTMLINRSNFHPENHRTESAYENNLIIKIFMFQFVNSYTSLYYVAFFKNGSRFWGESTLKDRCRFRWKDSSNTDYATGCIDELTLQLAAILGTNIVIGLLNEIFVPILKRYVKSFAWKEGKSRDLDKRGNFEKQSVLQEDPGTLNEYAEMGKFHAL